MNTAVQWAAALLLKARLAYPGASAELIIIVKRHGIEPEEIGSTKAEIKKIARAAIIERTLVLMAAAEEFRLDFDLLIAAADFTPGQRHVAERLKRSGPSGTLFEEAKAFQIL